MQIFIMNDKLNSGKRRFRAWGTEDLTDQFNTQSSFDTPSKSRVFKKVQIFVFKKIVNIKKYLSQVFAI